MFDITDIQLGAGEPDLDVAVAHRKDLAREIERIGAQMPLKGK